MIFEEILPFIEEIQINDILVKFESDKNGNKQLNIHRIKEEFENAKRQHKEKR